LYFLTNLQTPKVEAPKGANDPFSTPRVALKPGSGYGGSGQEVHEHGFRGPTAAMMRHAMRHVQYRSEQCMNSYRRHPNEGLLIFPKHDLLISVLSQAMINNQDGKLRDFGRLHALNGPQRCFSTKTTILISTYEHSCPQPCTL
jgi:hypothetical protein